MRPCLHPVSGSTACLALKSSRTPDGPSATVGSCTDLPTIAVNPCIPPSSSSSSCDGHCVCVVLLRASATQTGLRSRPGGCASPCPCPRETAPLHPPAAEKWPSTRMRRQHFHLTLEHIQASDEETCLSSELKSFRSSSSSSCRRGRKASEWLSAHECTSVGLIRRLEGSIRDSILFVRHQSQSSAVTLATAPCR